MRKQQQYRNTNFEIGIDIEDTGKFSRLTRTDAFVKNNYTSDEIRYCFSKSEPAIHLAGIFCAKEALIKALKERIPMLDIGISHEKNGSPTITLLSKIKSSKDSYNISISHTKTVATAIVIRRIK
jgi:holo-[acyl-carrier protein] synthase